MAVHEQIFVEAVGGYDDPNNTGNSAAVTDNSSQFYVDLGKTSAYETIVFSNTIGSPNLLDYGTILGLEVVIKNAYGADEATVEVALYHGSSTAFTSNIRLDPPTSAETVTVGGPTELWGKTWIADDINNIQVKIHDPVEPNAGIALLATYVSLKVYYNPAKIPGKLNVLGILSLNDGIINL